MILKPALAPRPQPGHARPPVPLIACCRTTLVSADVHRLWHKAARRVRKLQLRAPAVTGAKTSLPGRRRLSQRVMGLLSVTPGETAPNADSVRQWAFARAGR